MESYLKSWKGITKDFQSFSCKNGEEFIMKDSLKLEGDREKSECKDPKGDSLPIHCIIQTYSSLKDLKMSRCQHCEETNVSRDCDSECECKSREISDCVVVPGDTLMDDLIRTALVKLGYPASLTSFATASILIRNWKPIPIENACSDMNKKVSDILGEVSTIAQLKIKIFKPEATVAQKMKDDLLLFLVKVNQNFLRESCCPLDLSLWSKICDPSAHMEMDFAQNLTPEELQRKFKLWLEHLQDNEKASVAQKSQLPSTFCFENNNKNTNNDNSQQLIKEKIIPNSLRLESTEQEIFRTLNSAPVEKENLNLVNDSNVPKQFPASKTRIRTSFDPELELPKLQKWYRKNPHPNRQQIYEYVAELNSLESRKGRKQLDINNVVYWFKNARAAQKRTECRRVSSVPSVESNHCNVLKIPLGKGCELISDDQRSVSDDEASVTSESGDENRSESGRCLQVLGKWNSNGQGEAVLEMQIPSGRNEFAQNVQAKKDTKIGDDNTTTIQEKINESVKQNTFPSNKKEFYSRISDKNLVPNDDKTVPSAQELKNGIKVVEVTGKKQNSNGEDKEKTEQSLKVSAKSSFPLFKENKVTDYLSSYQPGFPVPPSSVLNSSFICMSQYINSKPSNLPLSSEERRKRNRTFIDPVTEVPRLEQWFRLSTHPSHTLIARYTEELNNMPYRRKFPKLEAKNVQFWFKNRRAKNKRLNYLETNNN